MATDEQNSGNDLRELRERISGLEHAIDRIMRRKIWRVRFETKSLTQIEPLGRISAAMDYDIGVVLERYMRDYNIPPEVAKEHEREVKRYLAMCAINPSKPYGMRGPADKLWHTFLMFSKQYVEFCRIVAGRFIHHVPETGESKITATSYKNTFEDYRKYFGEEPPAHIWPQLKEAEAACSSSCDTCGGGDPGCSGGCSGCDACGGDCDAQ